MATTTSYQRKDNSGGDFSKGGYMRIAEFRSESNPSKWYVVAVRALNDGTQQMTCGCPGWIYAKKEGCKKTGCKHIKKLMNGDVTLRNATLTPAGAAFMASLKARHIHDVSKFAAVA
jgi:hypothetical protein